MTYYAGYYLYSGLLYLCLCLWQWKKPKLAMAIGLFALIVVILYNQFQPLLSTLGGDTIFEAGDFAADEAGFYFTTLDYSPSHLLNMALMIGLYTLMTGLIFILINRLALLKNHYYYKRARLYFNLTIAVLCLSFALYHGFSGALGVYLDNKNDYKKLQDNFKETSPLPHLILSRKNLTLIVYIGETNAIMNMGLYGYPINTTPLLSHLAATDPHLLVFHNIFPTFSQTTPSLIEALSFGLVPREVSLPVFWRKRLSLIRLLDDNHVPSFLYSNQPQEGSWSFAEKLIFKQAQTPDLALYHEPKHFDADLFSAALKQALNKPQNGQDRIIFLHSYAGHGPYLAHIPPSFRPIAAQQNTITNYNAAISYVDYSVAQTIQSIKNKPQPLIMVYFADHGESVYLDRGHDASRFVHEMLRVPLIIYFNPAAQARYPALFKQYQTLAHNKQIASLAQMPATILDLLGAQLPSSSFLHIAPPIGSKTKIPPLLVRQTAAGISAINLNSTQQPYGLLDGADPATKTFIQSYYNHDKNHPICAETPPDPGAARRSSLVAECLNIHLDRTSMTKLQDIFTLARLNKLILRLNATQTITSLDQCLAFGLYLKQNAPPNVMINIVLPNRPWLFVCLPALHPWHPSSNSPL